MFHFGDAFSCLMDILGEKYTEKKNRIASQIYNAHALQQRKIELDFAHGTKRENVYY